MSAEDTKYQGACYCGAVEVSVAGDPAASAICHCHSCRKWHAAPLNAWSIWPSAQVTISGGETITSATDEASGRVSCAACGGCVANHKPKAGMTVVYPMTLLGSGLTFVPAFHIYYAERVMDLADGLPKFADMPEGFRGSGEMLDEPEKTGWCG
ncbi:MAG: GFA family protein [Rhizobiales bacterium]|nr:GFA family protein [Hyphomicrobiales bacterium]